MAWPMSVTWRSAPEILVGHRALPPRRPRCLTRAAAWLSCLTSQTAQNDDTLLWPDRSIGADIEASPATKCWPGAGSEILVRHPPQPPALCSFCVVLV